MATYKLTQKTDANGTTQDIKLDASCIDNLPQELYWCTYGTTTYAEITQAVTDGKLPVIKYSGITYTYSKDWGSSLGHVFGTMDANFDRWVYCKQNSTWGTGYMEVENSVNKTQSLSSSSTITQYPSAKCVYDNLQTVIGNIPTKTSDLTNDSGFITNSYHDNTKQDTLVSGTNIKTINNNSILGSGNLTISADTSDCLKNNVNGTIVGSSSDTPLFLQSKSTGSFIGFKNSSGTTLGYFGVNSSKKPIFYDTADRELALKSDVSGKQDALVSGTNIKTINGSSVLGSGDLTVSGTPQLSGYTFTLKSSITSTKTATSSLGLSRNKTYLLVPYSLTSSIPGIRMATSGSTSLNNASSAPIFCYCKNDTDYGITLWWNLQGSSTNDTMITYLAYCRVYEVATA